MIDHFGINCADLDAAKRAARKARAIHDRDDAVALKNALEAAKVRLAVKAGGEGRLFGAVMDGFWMHVGDPAAREAAEARLHG